MRLETAEPVAHVSDEARLAELAVVDHIEAGIHLLADHFGDRLFDACGKLLFVDRFAARFGADHLQNVGGARQAAGVSRQDTVG